MERVNGHIVMTTDGHQTPSESIPDCFNEAIRIMAHFACAENLDYLSTVAFVEIVSVLDQLNVEGLQQSLVRTGVEINSIKNFKVYLFNTIKEIINTAPPELLIAI